MGEASNRFWATVDWIGRAQTIGVMAVIAFSAFGVSWGYAGIDWQAAVVIAVFLGGAAFVGACYVLAPFVTTPQQKPSIYSDRAALGLPPKLQRQTPHPTTQPPTPRRELTGEQIAAKIRNVVSRTHGDWKRIKAHTYPGSERPTPRQWALAAGNYASQRARETPAFNSSELPTDAYRAWEEKIRERLVAMAPALSLEFSVKSAEYVATHGPVDYSGCERDSHYRAANAKYAKGQWEHAAKVLLDLALRMDG